MDKRLCERIVQNFDFKTMEVVNEYILHRSSVIHKQMETCSLEEITKLQGEIFELKQLGRIRDYAIAIIEKDKG